MPSIGLITAFTTSTSGKWQTGRQILAPNDLLENREVWHQLVVEYALDCDRFALSRNCTAVYFIRHVKARDFVQFLRSFGTQRTRRTDFVGRGFCYFGSLEQYLRILPCDQHVWSQGPGNMSAVCLRWCTTTCTGWLFPSECSTSLLW